MTTRPHLGERTTIADRDPGRAARLTANLSPAPWAEVTFSAPAAQAMAECHAKTSTPARPIRSGYRRNSVFHMHGTIEWRVLDRNQRARLWLLAQTMERLTKAKGRRNGCLGYIGMTVLNALLFGFLNANSGRCDPSYDTLQKKTGVCRKSISKAIDRLEASGLLTVTRRMMRFRDELGVLVTRQISNAYVLTAPNDVKIPERVVGEPARAFHPRGASLLDKALAGLFDKVSGRVHRGGGNLKHPLAPRYATVPR